MKKRITGYDYHSVGIKNQNRASPRESRKTKFVFRFLFLASFVALLMMVYIWSRVQILEYGYEIYELDYENRRLGIEKKKLQVELSTLKSPVFINEVARKKLNLTDLDLKQIQYINP